MKKTILFIIIGILLYSYKCEALTTEQQDNIATYAIELIEKGNARKAKDGTPLLKYNSGENRLPAFKNQLNKGHFVFNCDSFVSYVLSHTYGVGVIKSDNTPYTVSNYEVAAKREHIGMYVVDTGSYEKIKPSLVKGDIVICYNRNNESTHIFLYVGDGLIAQARYAGLVVETFDSYAVHYKKYMLIRLKEEAVTKPVDMSIVWPDTQEVEILGKDDFPTVKITYDDSKYYHENNIVISMEDDKKIDSYSVSDSNAFNWTKVDKQKDTVNYSITKNGTYNVSVRDSKGQVKTEKININNIDNSKPEIQSIEYKYNGNDTYNIIVKAKDDTEIKYSLDGVSYQTNNTFSDVKLENYTLKVIDEALNVSESAIKLSSNNIPSFKLSYDKTKNSIVINKDNDSVIKKYAIQKEFNNEVEWQDFKNLLIYPIDKTGTYYVWLMNSDGVPFYNSVKVDSMCDASKISYTYTVIEKNDANFSVKINNDSGCDLTYSIDGKNYQSSNTIYNISYGNAFVHIKDASGNIYKLSVYYDNNSKNMIYIMAGIIVVAIAMFIGYRYYQKKH